MNTYYQDHKEKMIEWQKEYNKTISKKKSREYNNKYYNNVRRHIKYPKKEFEIKINDTNLIIEM